MKLIWTYSEKLQKGPINPRLNKEYIFDLYRKSIECAKPYYDTCVYTTNFGAEFFKDKVDEVIILPEDFQYTFLGDLKYYVLENEKPGYIMIDGDLFLETKLQFDKECDFVFEHIIDYSDDSPETKFNNFFLNEKINEVIPYWVKTYPSYNLGLVYVNNSKIIKGLCEDFKKVQKFYNEKIEPKYGFDRQNEQPSIVGVQYFLSLYCNINNLNISFFNTNNKFTHLAAHRKLNFKTSINRFKSLL